MTRHDVLVLCALGRTNPPSQRELVTALEPLGLSASMVVETLAQLRAHGLVEVKRRIATEDGKRVVREVFGVSRTPSWKEAKVHAAALALALVPGSVEAQRAFAKSLPATVLAQHFGLEHTTNVRSVCEQLLFARLAMPVFAVRDHRLLGQVLAWRAGVELRGKLDSFAARVAASVLAAHGTKKDLLVEALARRWFSAEVAPTTSSFDDTVRAGLSRVPPSGRYGDEKVFIASLWDTIAREAPAEMDLTRFKRWLLDANAKQAVVLARADLVGAMDPVQVSASEIVDRGASFHFVLDNR